MGNGQSDLQQESESPQEGARENQLNQGSASKQAETGSAGAFTPHSHRREPASSSLAPPPSLSTAPPPAESHPFFLGPPPPEPTNRAGVPHFVPPVPSMGSTFCTPLSKQTQKLRKGSESELPTDSSPSPCPSPSSIPLPPTPPSPPRLGSNPGVPGPPSPPRLNFVQQEVPGEPPTCATSPCLPNHHQGKPGGLSATPAQGNPPPPPPLHPGDRQLEHRAGGVGEGETQTLSPPLPAASLRVPSYRSRGAQPSLNPGLSPELSPPQPQTRPAKLPGKGVSRVGAPPKPVGPSSAQHASNNSAPAGATGNDSCVRPTRQGQQHGCPPTRRQEGGRAKTPDPARASKGQEGARGMKEQEGARGKAQEGVKSKAQERGCKAGRLVKPQESAGRDAMKGKVAKTQECGIAGSGTAAKPTPPQQQQQKEFVMSEKTRAELESRSPSSPAESTLQPQAALRVKAPQGATTAKKPTRSESEVGQESRKASVTPPPLPALAVPPQRPEGRWPAFRVDLSCTRQARCRHTEGRTPTRLPRNVLHW
ncbi:hypothetical protein EOD39_12272 [Acipenser ruthenus]|uniref:Uncharacterized protein n=1 Tax=Acipenser ruthenus TaxID=7906 RepID=A0A444ULL9_ACIRT|nr:hypothetical protein EOD39_12272 [Acipenser ruthenus]